MIVITKLVMVPCTRQAVPCGRLTSKTIPPRASTSQQYRPLAVSSAGVGNGCADELYESSIPMLKWSAHLIGQSKDAHRCPNFWAIFFDTSNCAGVILAPAKMNSSGYRSGSPLQWREHSRLPRRASDAMPAALGLPLFNLIQ